MPYVGGGHVFTAVSGLVLCRSAVVYTHLVVCFVIHGQCLSSVAVNDGLMANPVLLSCLLS